MTETAPASGRSIDATTTAILLIAAAAAALAVAARWGHDFSVDEPFTLLTIEHWRSTLRASLVHDNTPLTYVLLIGWRRVFGGSALALRSPFILAFAAAVVVAGLTARRLAGGGAGVLAAVMVASSVRIGLFHAATIRPYACLPC